MPVEVWETRCVTEPLEHLAGMEMGIVGMQIPIIKCRMFIADYELNGWFEVDVGVCHTCLLYRLGRGML